MENFLNDLQNETSYVGKINQNDLSIPLSYAAIGNESYGDMYNYSINKGYDITGTSLPKVINSSFTEPSIATRNREIAPNKHVGNIDKNTIAKYRDQFANEWGIPSNIARAIIKQESGGNYKAVSKAGAGGVMQLMPATAKALGVQDRFDPAQNIWGGMKYLAQQYKQFGNWEYALAAYNAGPGAVKKHRGIPPFAETQRYVKNIMAMAGMSWSNNTYPITHSFDSIKNKNKFINSDTNMLSMKGMNDFIYDVTQSDVYKNKVDQILTNRPELLENKPEYADYKKYREMKNAEGKPLFVKSDFNGFKVMIKKDENSKSGKFNFLAIDSVADNVAQTQTNYIAENSKDQIKALLYSFGDRYDASQNYNMDDTFGLANLTAKEYEDYGIPTALQQNPILQARVLNQEFQRAIDVLGSEGKAIYALAGGDVTDEEGNIRSWKEIKEDQEAFLKQWFIKPSSDNKKRNNVNKIVEQYNKALHTVKGV